MERRETYGPKSPTMFLMNLGTKQAEFTPITRLTIPAQVAKLQETSLLVPSLDYLIQRLLWFSKAQLPYMARQTGTEW